MPFGWGHVSKVMISPQRHSKTGMYRLRKAVPTPLQERVAVVMGKPGKRIIELIQTLRTKDVKEAKRLMPAAMGWADGILDAARLGANPLTHREMHALAALWYQNPSGVGAGPYVSNSLGWLGGRRGHDRQRSRLAAPVLL